MNVSIWAFMSAIKWSNVGQTYSLFTVVSCLNEKCSTPSIKYKPWQRKSGEIRIVIHSKTPLKAAKNSLSLFESLNPDFGPGWCRHILGCWLRVDPSLAQDQLRVLPACPGSSSVLPPSGPCLEHPPQSPLNVKEQLAPVCAPLSSSGWLSFSPASKVSLSLQENTFKLV